MKKDCSLLITLLVACCATNVNAQTDIEFVDLGLPSKTLWANMNVGAQSIEDPGYYLAWGETKTKDEYSWATYKWCNGTQNVMTKYVINETYGVVDDKKVLDLEDDAAAGDEGIYSPSAAQLAELIDKKNCTLTAETVGETKGIRITGSNGNSIFIPAGGFKTGTRLSSGGSAACIWSRELTTSAARYYYNANVIRIGLSRSGSVSVDPRDHNGSGFVPRNYGYNMRAVKNPTGTGGINDATVDSDAVPVRYFNAYGVEISEPAEGLNIVVFSDGTSKKIIKK